MSTPDQLARRADQNKARDRLVADTSHTLRRLQQQSTLDKKDRIALAAADVLLLKLNKELGKL